MRKTINFCQNYSFFHIILDNFKEMNHFSMVWFLLTYLYLGYARIIKSVHIDVSCWSRTTWSTSVNTISWFIGIFGSGHGSRDTSQFWNMCRFYSCICWSFNEWCEQDLTAIKEKGKILKWLRISLVEFVNVTNKF